MPDYLKDFQKYMATASTRQNKKVKVIPTSSFGFNHVVGKPGLPLNHITEVFGPPGVGKTTLANYLMANAQRRTKRPVFVVDVEGKFDIPYARLCGVNTNEDMFGITDNADVMPGEVACDLTTALVASKAYSTVVFDSLGAVIPHAILEADSSDQFIGLEARLIGRMFKKLTIYKQNANTAILMINQIRARIGGYGSNESTPGGWTREFLSTVRIRVGRGTKIDYKGKQVGYYMNLTCHKNGLGETWRTGKIPLIYHKGIYPPMELLLTAKELGIVTGSSSYTLHLDGQKALKLGVGMIAASKKIWLHRKELRKPIKDGLIAAQKDQIMRVLE